MLQFQFRVIIIKMSVYSPLYACSLTHALIHASNMQHMYNMERSVMLKMGCGKQYAPVEIL